MEKTELYVWEGDPSFGLPSMDLESMQMLLYVKFTGAPVDIIYSVTPSSAPKGKLPVLKCSDGELTDFSAVATYFRKHNYSCDHDLSRRQCSEVLAFQNLLREKLLPAITYLWWVKPSNYQEVIYPWFYSHMRFPSKLWVPGQKHKHAEEFIEILAEEPDDIIAVETEILRHAEECISMMSKRLGEREYYFGKSPSTLDAVLISYLALLYKVDLKEPVLQNYIKACPNLSRYVNKTLQRFFPNELKSAASTTSRPESTENTDPDPNLNEFPFKKRNTILFGLAALALNICYVVATGIVQVDMGRNGDDALEDEYYDIDDE